MSIPDLKDIDFNKIHEIIRGCVFGGGHLFHVINAIGTHLNPSRTKFDSLAACDWIGGSTNQLVYDLVMNETDDVGHSGLDEGGKLIIRVLRILRSSRVLTLSSPRTVCLFPL